MGEVYRARDTKLKRDVAIKILPDEFSLDADRVSRFQREAEVLASLNHSNIAAIYDLQQVNDTRFLVLELVEGETLADRIARGPIPVDEALDIAKNICEALEAAHERGIIHRDLKPANVKITPDGKVKVLDFGLAKVREAPSAVGLADSPTLLSGSMPGVIMGTAGYMSPEQARGRNADHRSDVFSFGCMFYEMLTGRPTFQGEEVSDVLASVLKSEPDMNLLPANLNPRLPELLRRCLAKNRKDRWHAVGDLRVEIERLLSDPFGMVSVPQTAPKPRLFPMVAIPLLTAIVVGIAVGVTVWNLKPPVHGLVARLSVVLPADQDPSGSVLAFIATKGFGGPISFLPLNGASNVRQMAEGNGRHLAFSRDGRWVAYEERAGERSQILIRPYPGLNTKYQITEDGNFPVWSPDSKQLFYISAPNKFFVVDIQTEPSFAFGKPLELPIAGTLHDRNGPRNYDITPDGKQFVVVMPVSQTETNQPSAQINVVLNWLDELKQRVPVK